MGEAGVRYIWVDELREGLGTVTKVVPAEMVATPIVAGGIAAMVSDWVVSWLKSPDWVRKEELPKSRPKPLEIGIEDGTRRPKAEADGERNDVAVMSRGE